MTEVERDLVARTVQEHTGALLRTARRHSLCLDDAHDAYQRALEVFMRNVARLDQTTVVNWLHTVVKHEAMAVRRQRQQLVAAEEVDLDQRAADDGAALEERVLRFDRLARSAEALERLKPHEVRALWLKAQGHSYQEIAESEGWSYTKVNRCITEGRRAFLARYAGIESGAECERWAPVVSAMVDGEATAEQLAEVRPHLRRCAGCRATVRELQLAGPRLGGLLPLLPLGAVEGVVAPQSALARVAQAFADLHDRVASALAGVQDRVAGSLVKAQMATETASVTKVAAVAASSVAIAGGGAVTAQRTGVLRDDGKQPGQSQSAANANERAAVDPVTSGAAQSPAPVVLPRAATAPAGPAARAAGDRAAARRASARRRAAEAARAASPAREFGPEAADPMPADSGASASVAPTTVPRSAPVQTAAGSPSDFSLE